MLCTMLQEQETPPSLPEIQSVSVKFTGAVLVCGDCEDRSDGPRKLCARDVRKALKRELASAGKHAEKGSGNDARFRLRIVQCSCLGLCPKKAMAVVGLQSAVPLLAAEIKSEAEVGAFGRQLMAMGRG